MQKAQKNSRPHYSDEVVKISEASIESSMIQKVQSSV